MTDFEKHGYWWLPQTPEKRIAGTICYGHERMAELKLLGSFQDELHALQQMGRLGESHSPEIILGLTADGKRFTLYESLRSGGHFAFNSFLTEVYMPSIVLEGRHFSNTDEMVFHHMTLRLSHLGEWYQQTGRHVEFVDSDSDKGKVTMTYQNPAPLAISLDNGHIELGLDGNITLGRFSGDFVVSEKACVSVYPKTPIHMNAFLDDFLPPIVHFFTAGVGRTLRIKELRGKAADDCRDGSDEHIKCAPSIQLYWAKPQQVDEDKELFPHDMVFTRIDIADGLEKCLQQWVNAYQEIKPVMQLFFSKVIAREAVSSNSFLNAVQAAEAYHRYRRNGKELSESEHSDRINRVMAASPEIYRDWLDTRLQHSNEIGLRKRLKELLTEQADLYDFSSSDIKKHVDRITAIRNHFTHYSGEKAPDFATGRDFYIYDTLMTWTMLACLLEEMGIDRQDAHQLILRNQSFLHFKVVYLKQRQVEIMKVESIEQDKSPISEAQDRVQ
jgi:hypothetical protein